VPVVMSQRAAGNFGISSADEIGCVGHDVTSFKQCVLDVHSNLKKWGRVRKNGLDFIKRTHNRATLLESWSAIIDDAMDLRATLATCDPTLEFAACSTVEVTDICRTGEKQYQRNYPDVRKSIQSGYLGSAWEHFKTVGFKEGRIYVCCDEPCRFVETHACSKGEAAYKAEYPMVVEAIKAGSFESAFDHFHRIGRSEGRDYVCCDDPNECRYDKCARLVKAVEYPLPEGLCDIDLEMSRNIFSSGKELLPTLERCIGLQNKFCTSNSQDDGAEDDEAEDNKLVQRGG
jgi:hypothetical protein